jgi:tetratricopeptide (TPR) repeat protein
MSYGFTQACEGRVSVLFEIEINMSFNNAKRFADITHLSYMPGEKEILFGMGAIFRLVSVDDYPDMCWVKIQLWSDNDTELKPVLDHLRSRISEETSVCHFAIVLYEMGLFNKARDTFEQLLKLCPTNHSDIVPIYRFLGQIADEQGHYNKTIDYYCKTMNLERELLSSDDPERAKTLLNLAVVQKTKGDVNSALISLEEALSIWKHAYGEHHGYIANNV